MRVVSRKELMELIKDKDMLFADINSYGLEGLYVASCFGEHDFVRTCLISMIDIDEPHLTYGVCKDKGGLLNEVNKF